MPDWTVEKFWKRPTFDHTALGDISPDPIYWQVGRALTAWERLEEQIGSLFTVITSGQDTQTYHLTRYMFGITESSSNRIAMLRTALIIYFSHYWKCKNLSAPFKNAIKAIGWASHRRNEIAHGRVTNVTTVGAGKSIPSGNFLTAPSYAVNRCQPFIGGEWHRDDVLGIDRSLYRYRASDISIFEEKFTLLTSEIMKLQILSAKGDFQLPNIVFDLMQKGLLFQS